MTETEFHAARTMWVATDHGVLVAEPGDRRTHYEWVVSMFGAEVTKAHFDKLTRGYLLDGRLVAYKGTDFSKYVSHADVRAAALELTRRGHEVHTVGLGAVYSATKMPWPTKVEVDADTYLKMTQSS